MESNDRVRKNIRALRKYYGETMLDLSIAIDVSKSLISDWENGKKLIPYNNILKISKHYRTPSSYIMNYDLSYLDSSSVADYIVKLKNDNEYIKKISLNKIFPIFTSKEIKDSKKLSKALEMHKQLWALDLSKLDEVDFDMIIDTYEKVLSQKSSLSVLANYLSIIFFLSTVDTFSIEYYENFNKFLSNKSVTNIRKNAKFIVSNYFLNNIGEEDKEIINANVSDIDKFIMSSILKFKYHKFYSELGDYYRALRYVNNIVDNNLDREDNLLIGIMQLKDLRKLENRFAKKFLRMYKML